MYKRKLAHFVLPITCAVWALLHVGCRSGGGPWPVQSTTATSARAASDYQGANPAGSNTPLQANATPGAVIPAAATEEISPPGGQASGPVPTVPENAEQSLAEDDAQEERSLLSLDGAVESLKRLIGQDTNAAVARALYDEAMELYRQRRFVEAARRFQRAADRAPKSRLQEDALFMAGESWFFADRYPAAFEAYEQLLNAFDYTRYLDTVVQRQFSIGRYWEQLNRVAPGWIFSFQFSDPTRPKVATLTKAIRADRSVQLHDPTGPLADDAVMATANAYFLQGRYEDAAYEYDLLRKEYPKSEHLKDAYLLGIQAKLRSYQGPWYDGTALVEARQMAEQALVLFGDELGEERQRLVDQLNEMEEQFAERDLVIGQFYEKKQRYGAARLYYQAVIDEHPTTQAAEEARRRLEAIADYPDEPPNRFQWLVDLFPSEK